MKPNPDFERMLFAAEFKFADPAENLVEGYANVFGNLDSNGDVVRPGAFRKTISERVARGLVPLLDSHQWDAAHTIGTVMEAQEDAKGLAFRARLSNAPSAQDVRTKMIEGHIKRLSIGFMPVRESYERVSLDEAADGSARKRVKTVRNLHEIKLFEISAVPIAANEESIITSCKSAVPFQDLPIAARDYPWDAAAAEARVREWAGCGGSAAINFARYRRAFLSYDRDAADEPAAYKFPIADIVDGDLKAIPAAISQVAQALASDSPAAANLSRYYDKMAHEFDNESIVAPWKQKNDDLASSSSPRSGGDYRGASIDELLGAARALGVYELGDIRTAATELFGILSAEDRKRLLAELSAGPVRPPTGSEVAQAKACGGATLAALRRRDCLLNAELTRRRVS